MKLKVLQVVITLFLVSGSVFAQENTAEKDNWWWDDAWWDKGQLPVAKNYAVSSQWVTYKSGENEIRALVFRPKKKGKFPGVLFAHGRRGLDELVQKKVKRLAARGLVVLAPAVYESRFIDPLPYTHDYSLEEDFNKGVDALLRRKDIIGNKICVASHTRGGYYTLKTAVTKKRQIKDVACYVSWYPHMQDPNAPEPAQVYGYAPEADNLKIPVLIFVGENEQYQRRRSIESAVKQMKADGKDVRLIIYPGVGRGFDFRPESVRTFADDLASRDANRRAADFIYKHLK
ncbi:MAG: dienelactone hydrolase family protein [Acidiferrobacterales bacterium]